MSEREAAHQSLPYLQAAVALNAASHVFLPQVIDGTLCGPETLSICVRGQCVKAGCDHVVDSPRKLDKCGVCGGKGNSCRKVSGSLSPSR